MQEIADVLTLHASGHDDQRLGELLAISAGRVLRKLATRGAEWRSQAGYETLRHIADWLWAAIVNNEPWLENVDDHGRPKKLMKFSSIEQITREADKAMLKSAQKLSSVTLVDGDEEYFADLEDGFFLVRLLSPAALDRESAEMQHCIGRGGYDERLQDDDYLYLSMRDAAGKAHATLEVYAGKITQLQGKQNRAPVKTYADRLISFIREQGFEIAVSLARLGYLVDIHGDWHKIDALPENLDVGGDLELDGTSIKSLPKGMTVHGNLQLYGSSIEELPEGLKVRGDLALGNTNISVLPKGLVVGGNLYPKWQKPQHTV